MWRDGKVLMPGDRLDRPSRYHDTIAVFRRRFLPRIEALFVQVLVLAREMGGTGRGFAKRGPAPASVRQATSPGWSRPRAASWRCSNSTPLSPTQ